RDWSSDVCSSDLEEEEVEDGGEGAEGGEGDPHRGEEVEQRNQQGAAAAVKEVGEPLALDARADLAHAALQKCQGHRQAGGEEEAGARARRRGEDEGGGDHRPSGQPRDEGEVPLPSCPPDAQKCQEEL